MSQSDTVDTPGALALRAITADPGSTLLGLDFDGTIAPIIDDPDQAYANPDAVAALGRIGRLVRAVVVITGRPVRTAVRLGRFEETPGLEKMTVIGQYGVERWEAATGQFDVPPDPPEIGAVTLELPSILAELDLTEVKVEYKGRAIGVHTRTMADPVAAFERLGEPLTALAERHGLKIEPGKQVWEIRAPGVDKGAALRATVEALGAKQVIFAGDDLGDLPAFHMVQTLRGEGVPGLLVCSASHEEDALTSISDVVVDGSAGIAVWLTELADALERSASSE